MINLPTNCDLAVSSVTEAMLLIDDVAGKVRWVYELHVSEMGMPYASNMLRKIGATLIDNPFAPFVNLVADTSLEREAWFLRARQLLNPMNIIDVGSPGAT